MPSTMPQLDDYYRRAEDRRVDVQSRLYPFMDIHLNDDHNNRHRETFESMDLLEMAKVLPIVPDVDTLLKSKVDAYGYFLGVDPHFVRVEGYPDIVEDPHTGELYRVNDDRSYDLLPVKRTTHQSGRTVDPWTNPTTGESHTLTNIGFSTIHGQSAPFGHIQNFTSTLRLSAGRYRMFSLFDDFGDMVRFTGPQTVSLTPPGPFWDTTDFVLDNGGEYRVDVTLRNHGGQGGSGSFWGIILVNLDTGYTHQWPDETWTSNEGVKSFPVSWREVNPATYFSVSGSTVSYVTHQVIFEGKAYTIPAGGIDLSRQDSNWGDKTWLFFVTLRIGRGGAIIEASTELSSDEIHRAYIGHRVGNGSIAIHPYMKIGNFRFSE